MSDRLDLRFPDASHVIVSLGNRDSGSVNFKHPLKSEDRQDLRWYIETYGVHSLGDPDDSRAKRIAAHLPKIGEALFEAVFHDRAAARLFDAFQNDRQPGRMLTISAEQSSILALPWELLRDPAGKGVFLFMDNPRISIRRRVAGAEGGAAPCKVETKDRLHILFVVSRPDDAGFLDPRADPQAVLDALDEHAPGRCTWEFLYPPTLDALSARLRDRRRTAVDVVHFDGHGVFDKSGGLPELMGGRDASAALQEVALKDRRGDGGSSPANTGYLLFETPDGKSQLVSADLLSENLHQNNVPLVILSACQSAEQAAETAGGEEDEPLGSVAAALTAGGTPAVLAMTHSVLVATTRSLFGQFYKWLARGRRVGESLDGARAWLYNNPKKYEVPRGAKRVPLSLYDWFVPALYSAGDDVPLLSESHAEVELPPKRTNVPKKPEAGFFGRRRELWEIERGFVGKARRITITGFGGQGKTALGQEAARWLLRTGQFEACVFVDYTRSQAADAASVAVNEIGGVLGETFIDAEAARKALKKTPALVVLDNLESVTGEPLRELLDAAVGWSEAGGSRVLITTRSPEFGHSAYALEGTNIHRRIRLDGLGSERAPDDALEWFAELFKLPPAPELETPSRDALIGLFAKVRFHPLSIRVLAQQLKTRRPHELGERLGALLAGRAGGPAENDATIPELVASVELSLDRVDACARAVLLRLGVLQGGALEVPLLAIAGLDEQTWIGLRRQLEAAALVEAESIPGVIPPYLRFHPTLAPMLWARLSSEERSRLTGLSIIDLRATCTLRTDGIPIKPGP